MLVNRTVTYAGRAYDGTKHTLALVQIKETTKNMQKTGMGALMHARTTRP